MLFKTYNFPNLKVLRTDKELNFSKNKKVWKIYKKLEKVFIYRGLTNKSRKPLICKLDNKSEFTVFYPTDKPLY